MSRPRVKANFNDLIAQGLQFFQCDRVTLYHPYGDKIKGERYICDHLTQSQKDSLHKFKNVHIHKCHYRHAPEITHDVVFIGDKCFPEYNALEV